MGTPNPDEEIIRFFRKEHVDDGSGGETSPVDEARTSFEQIVRAWFSRDRGSEGCCVRPDDEEYYD